MNRVEKIEQSAVWVLFSQTFLRILIVSCFLAAALYRYSLALLLFYPQWAILLVVGLIIVALFGSLGWAVLLRNSYRYGFHDDVVELRYGVINKQSITVRYDKIQDVTVYRSFLSRLFNLAELRIQTAGALGYHSEVRIPGLRQGKANEYSDFLRKEFVQNDSGKAPLEPHGTQQGKTMLSHARVEWKRLPRKAVLAFFLDTFGPVLIAGFLLSFFVGALATIGAAAYDHSIRFTSLPVIIIASCLLVTLVICVLGFFWSVLRYNAFGYSFEESHMSIQSGVLVKRELRIPYRNIQNVDAHRGIVNRLIGLSTLVVRTAGSSMAAGIIPALNIEEAQHLRSKICAMNNATKAHEKPSRL